MKGILFKPDMIQAIVEGRKTHTRRAEAILKELNREPDAWELLPGHEPDSLVFLFRNKELSEIVSAKPRYQVSETVYIKEAWGYYGQSSGRDGFQKHIRYLSDDARRDVSFSTFEEMVSVPPHQHLKYPQNFSELDLDEQEYVRVGLCKEWWEKQHRNSPLLMPEWAARHFIKILAVRAERLQKITNEDAIAEGIIPPEHAFVMLGSDIDAAISPREEYAELWNSLNRKYPFESNPWVFPYDFEFVKEVN